jgi:hypothetical protein
MRASPFESTARWFTQLAKGPKQRLRFTKSRDPKLEEAYATHFVWPGKGPFHPPVPAKENPRDTGSDREIQSCLAKEQRT